LLACSVSDQRQCCMALLFWFDFMFIRTLDHLYRTVIHSVSFCIPAGFATKESLHYDKHRHPLWQSRRCSSMECWAGSRCCWRVVQGPRGALPFRRVSSRKSESVTLRGYVQSRSGPHCTDSGINQSTQQAVELTASPLHSPNSHSVQHYLVTEHHSGWHPEAEPSAR
jgi:hypothetical protein